MKTVLISACLLGVSCRYAGDGKCVEEIEQLKTAFRLIPVCPEQLGGLPTPRKPSERRNGRVVSIEGTDVTEAFERGANEALKLAKLFGAEFAILKERSPSCGSGVIYDGTFAGAKTEGDGVTSELLKENGIRVFGESEIPRLLAEE